MKKENVNVILKFLWIENVFLSMWTVHKIKFKNKLDSEKDAFVNKAILQSAMNVLGVDKIKSLMMKLWSVTAQTRRFW